jgi:hypothetical protein
MKVNVKGYGRIPGTNMLAPKLGIDMTRDQILTASTSPEIHVYDAKTHVYLTRANIDKFFEIEANEQVGVVAAPIVEKKTEVVEEPVVNNKVSVTIQALDDDNKMDRKYDADNVKQVIEAAEVEAVEIVENEVDEVADAAEVPSTVEETTEEVVEEKPYQFKKKNKKKH